MTDIHLLLENCTPIIRLQAVQKDVLEPDLKPPQPIPSPIQKSFNRACYAMFNCLKKDRKKLVYLSMVYEILPLAEQSPSVSLEQDICDSQESDESDESDPYDQEIISEEETTLLEDILEDIDIEKRLYGDSGGLSMAIAFMFTAMNKKPTQMISMIGATGVIKDIENGRVEKVGGIEKKISKALENLPSNSRIFYPADNKEQIDYAIETKARQKQIELIPVCALKEIVDLFFPPPKPYFPILLVFLFLIYSFFIASFHPLTKYLLENGHYNCAVAYSYLATKMIPLNYEAQPLHSALTQSFTKEGKTSIVIWIRRIYGPDESYFINSIPPICKKDRYQLKVNLPISTYIYLFRVSSTQIKRLYQLPKKSVKPTRSIDLPPTPKLFNLTKDQGDEELYLIISLWRCIDLEQWPKSDDSENIAKFKARLRTKDRKGKGTMMKVIRLKIEDCKEG